MADLGSVGQSLNTVYGPEPGNATNTYTFWWDPSNRANFRRLDGSKGPVPVRLGRANGTTSVDEVTNIVAGYGSPGGGVSIF